MKPNRVGMLSLLTSIVFGIALGYSLTIARAMPFAGMLKALAEATTPCTTSGSCGPNELCECGQAPCSTPANVYCCVAAGEPCTGTSGPPCCTNTSLSMACNGTAPNQLCCVEPTVFYFDVNNNVQISYPAGGVPLACSSSQDCCQYGVGTTLCTSADNGYLNGVPTGSTQTYCVAGQSGGTPLPGTGSCEGCAQNACFYDSQSQTDVCCVPEDGVSPCTTNSTGYGNCCNGALCGPKGVCCGQAGATCSPTSNNCCSGSCQKNAQGAYVCAACMGL